MVRGDVLKEHVHLVQIFGVETSKVLMDLDDVLERIFVHPRLSKLVDYLCIDVQRWGSVLFRIITAWYVILVINQKLAQIEFAVLARLQLLYYQVVNLVPV